MLPSALVCIALLSSAQALSAEPNDREQRCEVTVTLDNLRKSDVCRGQLYYTLFKGKEGCPDKSDLAYTNECVMVQRDSKLTFTINELPCNQEHALALLHDENLNQQLEKNLAIPKEGIGMSQNPCFTRVNAPPFDDVKFVAHPSRSAQVIRLHYWGTAKTIDRLLWVKKSTRKTFQPPITSSLLPRCGATSARLSFCLRGSTLVPARPRSGSSSS